MTAKLGERNPLRDPAPGDIVRRHNTERRVTFVKDGFVSFVSPRTATTVKLGAWRNWASDAQVTVISKDITVVENQDELPYVAGSRDPRLNPASGDVVFAPRRGWKRYVVEVSQDGLFYSPGENMCGFKCSLADWRAWCRKNQAVVVAGGGK